MTEKRCNECGGRYDEAEGIYRHEFVCSQNMLPGFRGRRYYPEKEQHRDEAMGRRPFHARYLKDSDACPTHGYSPWMDCRACESWADHAMEAGVDF